MIDKDSSEEKRLQVLAKCGVSEKTIQAARDLMHKYGISHPEWSIFANLDEDPVEIEFENRSSGIMIRILAFED